MMQALRKFFRWQDAAVIGALWILVAWSWCNANNMWTSAAWKLPTAYLDAEKSDVIFHLGVIRAAEKGD